MTFSFTSKTKEPFKTAGDFSLFYFFIIKCQPLLVSGNAQKKYKKYFSAHLELDSAQDMPEI